MNPFAFILIATCLQVLAAFAPAQDWGEQKVTTYDPPVKIQIGDETVSIDVLEYSPRDLIAALLKQYGREHDIRPTEAEIAQYSMVLETDCRTAFTKADELREYHEALKSPYLSTAQRKIIAAHRQEMKSGEAQLIAARASGETRREAIDFLQQWKINASLHARYGGRIESGSVAAEPVDAYQKLIDERQKAGAFEDWPPAVQRELLAFFNRARTRWGYTEAEGAEAGKAEAEAGSSDETYFSDPSWMKRMKDPANPPRRSSTVLSSFAAASYRQSKFKAAVDFANRGRALFPEDADLLTWRARGYLRLEKFPEAERDFQRAAELWPENPARNLELAVAYSTQGKLKEAATLLDEAVEAHANVATLTLRAKNLLARGQVDAAIGDLTRALAGQSEPKADPEASSERRSAVPELHADWVSATKFLGDAYLLKKEYALAVENYTTAIWRNWEFAEAWQGRAEAKKALGDAAGAAEDFAGAKEAARKRAMRGKEEANSRR
jgi:tetratricopeptide (TPR) repeat protein